MAAGRKVFNEQDARRCIAAARRTGGGIAVWARANGVDGRSLNAWYVNLGRRGVPRLRAVAPKLVELVRAPVTPVARAPYVMRVGGKPTAPPQATRAKRRYTFGAAPLAVTDINGSTRTTRALHVDALGSPGTETTLSASIAVNRQYDAWGAYRNGTAPTEVDAKLPVLLPIS